MSSPHPNFDYSLFNELPVLIMVIDQNFKIILWNKHLEAVSKVRSEEREGQNLLEIYPRLSKVSFVSRIESVLNGGPPSTFSYLLHSYFIEILMADGKFQKQNAIIKYHNSSEKGRSFATIMMIDMTEVYKQSIIIKDIRNEAYQQLEKSNQRLKNFSATVAHDLKTPLGNIKSLSEILMDETNDSFSYTTEQKQILNMIHNSVDRLGNLTSDLLDYSRAKNINIPEQPVSIDSIIKEIEEDLDNYLSTNKVKIIVSTNLPQVCGWHFLLRQLFQNLIVNSIKYKSVANPIININSEITEDSIQIIIEDNGIGFSESAAEEIFKPFHRLREKENVEGSGIGLATCQRIMEQHGGSIKAIGAEGVGAKFILNFLRTSEV